MGSTRLPGKILAHLAGAPMLARVVARVGRAATVTRVVVATTTEPADATVAELCVASGWAWYRGSQDDVLDRYYRAAAGVCAEVVVRITSDCPLIDPGVIDRVVREFLDRRPEVAYASNVVPTRSYPRGLDTEVFTFAALERAWHEDRDPASREHVTPYLHRHPELFASHCVVGAADHSAHRWTVDTPEDLELARRIYDTFGHDRFTWEEALAACRDHPEWSDLNRHVQQKAV
jgi:spore coat polysaccharide biosynthesis protein SpsF